MNTAKKVFLVIGDDFFQRRRLIENIKKTILQNKKDPLNIINIYTKETDFKTVQEKVLNFSFNQEKIVVFKDAYRLSPSVKDFLLKNFEKIISANYLILEIEAEYSLFRQDRKITSDRFFQFLFKEAVGLKTSAPAPETSSWNDFSRGMRQKDLEGCLYFLEKLFRAEGNGKELAPLILGVLGREISFCRDPQEKETGFFHLWQTDRQIKEKGIEAKLAIEILLIKLLTSSVVKPTF